MKHSLKPIRFSAATTPYSKYIVFVMVSLLGVAQAATVNFLAYDVVIAGHLELLDAFERDSGHTVTYTSLPAASLATGIKQDLEQDHLFDVYLTTSFEMEYGIKGLIKDITDDVVNTDDYDFDWGNILPVAKSTVTLEGKVYGVPIDANPVELLYRRDLIPTAPKTWEELIATATEFQGTDLNNDTTPDYGVCFLTKGRWQLSFFAIANTIFHYTSSKRAGFIFDINSDDTQPMESLITTDGWRYTMDLMKQLFDVSHQRPLSPGNDMYEYWRNGSCATFISFPSVAEQLIKDPGNGFDMRGKQGVVRSPGSTKVYNRATKSLEVCTPTLCPYQEFGSINRPAYSGDLMQLIVSPQAKDMKATLEFAAYFSKNVDVRVPGALNPFRSHHWNVSWWLESEPRPWLEEEATAYTETIYSMLTSEQTTNRPRIPVMKQVGSLFDAAMAEYCRLTPYENSVRTLDEILESLDADVFTTSTGLGYNRDELERYLRLDLGLPPRVYPEEPEGFPVWGAIMIALMVILILAFAAFVGATHWMKGAAARSAPQEGAPCTILVVSVYKCAKLWDLFPQQMPKLLHEYRKALRVVAAENGIYEVKRIGETNFVLAAKDVEKAATFAIKLQADISKAAWAKFGEDEEESVVEGPARSRYYSKGSVSRSVSSKASTSRSSRVGASTRSKTSPLPSKAASSIDNSQRSHHAKPEMLCDFTIAIGISHGTCRIIHDVELNTYDYHGSVVTDAAMLADLGASHQIFASEAVSDAIPQCSEYTVSSLCPWTLATGPQKLYQLQSPQMPKVFYVPTESEGEAGSGGALVALEQASGGLSTKKVTVLALNIHGPQLSQEHITMASKAAIMDAVTALHEELELLVPATKAHIHSSLSGNFVFTFNATTNVANPTRRAISLLLSIVDMVAENFPKWQVCAGLTASQAVVGQLGKHTKGPSIYGPLVQQASALAGLCRQYSDGRINCLAHQGLKDELWTTAFVQDLDFVHLPIATSAQPGGKRSMVTAVMDLKDIETDDEWMYQLEAAADKDPYTFTNNAFAAFAAGNVDQCGKILAKRDEQSDAEGEAASSQGITRLVRADSIAYAKLKSMLATHGDHPETYTSEQGKYFDFAFNGGAIEGHVQIEGRTNTETNVEDQQSHPFTAIQ